MPYPLSSASSAPFIGPLSRADATHTSAPPLLYKRRAGPVCVSTLSASDSQEEKSGRCLQERAQRLQRLLAIPGLTLASSMEVWRG